MRKKKEESTLLETPKKQSRPGGRGRLSSMIESMQQRSSPVNAHKVATQYFDNFRQERHILDEASGEKAGKKSSTAVNTGGVTTVTTAVTSTVKSARRKKAAKIPATMVDSNVLSDVLTPSESKIYLAMREESISKVSNELRFGLKYLKEKTGLSDKTVRVAIHSLEEKLCVQVVDSSQGIYGRKFRVYGPGEILEAHRGANIYIDSTTKKLSKHLPQ